MSASSCPRCIELLKLEDEELPCSFLFRSRYHYHALMHCLSFHSFTRGTSVGVVVQRAMADVQTTRSDAEARLRVELCVVGRGSTLWAAVWSTLFSNTAYMQQRCEPCLVATEMPVMALRVCHLAECVSIHRHPLMQPGPRNMPRPCALLRQIKEAKLLPLQGCDHSPRPFPSKDWGSKDGTGDFADVQFIHRGLFKNSEHRVFLAGPAFS